MYKKDNPVSVYAMVSQISFLVVVPLLLFIAGGSWLKDYFSLPSWTMIIFVLLGIITMAACVGTYLSHLLKYFDEGKKDENSRIKHDRNDHDW